MLKPEDNRKVINNRNPPERIMLKIKKCLKQKKLSPGTENLTE